MEHIQQGDRITYRYEMPLFDFQIRVTPKTDSTRDSEWINTLFLNVPICDSDFLELCGRAEVAFRVSLK
jgi:hypothetical protein